MQQHLWPKGQEFSATGTPTITSAVCIFPATFPGKREHIPLIALTTISSSLASGSTFHLLIVHSLAKSRNRKSHNSVHALIFPALFLSLCLAFLSFSFKFRTNQIKSTSHDYGDVSAQSI